jgi:hypothetical protein
MNLECEGSPVALIVEEGKKKNSIISVEKNKDKVNHYFTEFKCKPHQHIQPLPDVSKERTILYVSGQSGSGKSFFCKNFAQHYKKLFPKREVFLFSALAEDKGSIDKVKDIKRVKIHEDGFLIEPIDTHDFKDSLVIFDDCEAIGDRKLRKKIWEIQNSILTTGRHSNTSCCVCTHTLTNGNETKLILNEAHGIVLFPNGLGGRSLKYCLEGYFGLEKDQIKKIKKLDSRWVCVLKTYPMCVLSEKECYILNIHDQD